eukprot:13004-Heterococcus_DN1.PRE.1
MMLKRLYESNACWCGQFILQFTTNQCDTAPSHAHREQAIWQLRRLECLVYKVSDYRESIHKQELTVVVTLHHKLAAYYSAGSAWAPVSTALEAELAPCVSEWQAAFSIILAQLQWQLHSADLERSKAAAR